MEGGRRRKRERERERELELELERGLKHPHVWKQAQFDRKKKRALSYVMSCAGERHCNRSQAHRVCLAPPPRSVGLAPGPTAAAVVTRHELWKKHVIPRDTHTHIHIHTQVKTHT